MLDRPVGLSVAANVESCGTRFDASVHLIHMLDSVLVFITSASSPPVARLNGRGGSGSLRHRRGRRVDALDTRDGRVLWQHPLPAVRGYANPIV